MRNFEAILKMYPSSQWYIIGDNLETLVWLDQTTSKPTPEQIAAFIAANQGDI